MNIPFVTHRAKDAPVCVPVDDMTCAHCHLRLWDCSCPRSPECEFCKMSPEDADFVNPVACDDSPHGLHAFRETAREP